MMNPARINAGALKKGALSTCSRVQEIEANIARDLVKNIEPGRPCENEAAAQYRLQPPGFAPYRRSYKNSVVSPFIGTEGDLLPIR